MVNGVWLVKKNTSFQLKLDRFVYKITQSVKIIKLNGHKNNNLQVIVTSLSRKYFVMWEQ